MRNLSAVVLTLLLTPWQTGAAPPGRDSFTVASLSTLLVKTRHTEATFHETHYSTLLTEPLRSSGTLGFTPPDRIEKHVTAPTDELFIADAGKIFIVNKSKDFTKTLTVDDYPALAAFVESFRAVLGGKLENLQRLFDLRLSGDQTAWQLQASPREASMQQWVASIVFSGKAGSIGHIEIKEANGDRSDMQIDENPT